MSSGNTACSSNPDQWYTERDGRRYDDELLLSHEQVSAIAGEVTSNALETETPELEVLELIEEAVDEATAEVVRVRLIERRQAREACFACSVRLRCLDKALTDREQYGIWGGYYPEQRRAIERELDRRAEAKAASPTIEG